MHRSRPSAFQTPARSLRRLSLGLAPALVLAACAGDSGSAPVAAGDALALGEGATVTTTSDGRDNLLSNDTGFSANAVVSATPATAPQYGTVDLAADGTFTYTHDGSENHSDSFQYRVTEGSVSVLGTVTVTVDPVDDPPQLTDDAYGNAVGNTFLSVGRETGRAAAVHWTGSVLFNDRDPDGSLRISDYDETSEQGGTVTMEMDGTFSYLPPLGFNGDDAFTYEASDGYDSATATVTITVTGQVWWVDGYRDTAGDGRSGSPFQNFAQLDQAVQVGTSAVVYVMDGPTDYLGGYVLEENEILVGEGSAFTYGALDLPAGPAPGIVNPGGAGLTLASGSQVRGFEIGSTQDAGLVFQPGGVHVRPQVTDVSISGNGQAVSFQNAEVLATFDSIESLTSTGPGIEATGCTGVFEVLGETVTRSAGAQGIVISSPVGPDELEVTFGGLVSVVAPAGVALQISNMEGPVSFGDVAIASRGSHGIWLNTGTAAVTFGDVDIGNANDADGHGLIVQNHAGSTSFSSLDIDNVVHASDPGSNYGVQIDGNTTTFTFEVTAAGVQRNGGSIQDVDGWGVMIDSDGSVTLREMTFASTHRESIRSVNSSGALVVQDCTFATWSTGAGEDDPSVETTGSAADFHFTVEACDFDAAGVNTTLAPVVSVIGGSGRTDVVFGGVDQQDQRRRSNTMTGIRRDGLVIAAQSGVTVADVAGSSFTTVSGRRGVEALATLGRLSLGVDQCTFTGPFEVCTGISGVGGGADGAQVFATIQQNNVTGGQRFVDLIQDSITEMHTLVRNNTATGLTVGVVNYSGSPAGAAELWLDGGSYTVVPGVTLEPAVVVGLNGAFAVDVTEFNLLGFDSATHVAVDVAASVGNLSTATVRLDENALGNPTVAAFQAVLDGASQGDLNVAISDHTEGTFIVTRQAGTFGLEDPTNFGTNNPGATLTQNGTIDVLAPSSVPGPVGPWR